MTEGGSPGTEAFDAVVLAGGRARRLGGASKPDLLLGGRRLLDRSLDAVAGARAVVVVGPAAVAPAGVLVTREDPPGGGPVAGLAAGLAALPDGAPLVLVLACDLPRVAGAVPGLLAAGTSAMHDGALLVDAEGRGQPLAAVYRREALDRAMSGLPPDGAPMRAVLAGLRLVAVADPGGLGTDVDTWADVAAWHDDMRRAGPRSDAAPATDAAEAAMSEDEPRTLDHWMAALAQELGLGDRTFDVPGLLDVARDVAHGVARPAAPVSLFLVGFAAARAGGTDDDVATAAQAASSLAASWQAGADV